MEQCIHQIVKDQCHYCNGGYKSQEDLQKLHKSEYSERHDLNLKRKSLQKETELNAENHDKEWTDDELMEVIVTTHNHEKTELNLLYQIAMKLKRTLFAIEFIFIRTWEENKRDMFEGQENLIDRIDAIKTQLGV